MTVDLKEQATENLRFIRGAMERAEVGELSLPVPEIITYLSEIFTLDPGDLIFTGTPAGVAAVEPGDELVAELVGYTQLRITIADSQGAAPA